MPPIRLREGLAFPRDIPSAKHKGHPEAYYRLVEGVNTFHWVIGEGLYLPAVVSADWRNSSMSLYL